MKASATKTSVTKTNAARYLDSLGIPYELRDYDLGEEEFSAIAVAEKIGLPPEQVFKTLLCATHEREHLFAIVPGNAELDFKKLAHAAGTRKTEMASIKDVQPLTGYIRGGVTVFGAKKAFPVFVDETLELFDTISVSAGTRGTQLILTPAELPKAAESLAPTTVTDLTQMTRPYVLTHVIRDLRIEWRSKDAINSMLFFALIIVVLFSLAFDPTREVSRQIAGGILCVATMFASITALNQTWSRELRHQVLDAQRMAPAPASSLFLAKVLVNFLFVSVVQVVLAPLFIIFYNLRSVGPAWPLLLVLPLGTWALIVNGTFFAALSIRTRNRELLLPLILFPIYIPALLAMVLATTGILTGEADPTLWIKFLAGYDIIFTTVSLLLFETVIQAE